MIKLTQPLKWHGIECRVIPEHSDYAACEDGTILRIVSRSGGGFIPRVRQLLDTPKQLLPDQRKGDGRKRYTLRRDSGGSSRRYGSYFVLLAWKGPRPAGMEACHENGDCTDDSQGNLRWGTSRSNKADMVRHKTQPRGESHPKAKITDEQAASIVRRRSNGESLKSIAREFGITESAVCFIAKGKRKSCLNK